MASHHLIALVFAVLSLPAFVTARWLGPGRVPLAGDSGGMTALDKARLDDRLARLMRMIGVAMLLTGAGLAVVGDDQRRVAMLVVVMVVAVHGIGIAMLLAVLAARRRGRGGG